MRQPNPAHIIEWRERRGDQSGPAYDIKTRLYELKNAWASSPNGLLAEFIPIRISTCMEVYVREVVRELVDAGNPYADLAAKLVKNSKLDLAFAAHLSGKKLSIGDFVAHSVSINGIDAVISILSTLIEDFSQKLRAAHPLWTEEKETWPLAPIMADYETTIGSLDKVFEVRHVLTHELPNTPVTDNLDFDELCEAADTFVEACDWVVVAELHGSVPRTQTSMNIGAGQNLEEVQKSLEDAVSRAQKLDGIDVDWLNKIQQLWQEFSDEEASLVASQVDGGSMQPMIWAFTKQVLVENRIEQIHRLVDNWLD